MDEAERQLGYTDTPGAASRSRGGVSGSPVYCVARIVPESPRWLLSRGHVDEAERQLSYIAAVNTGQSVVGSGQSPAAVVKLRAVVSRDAVGQAGLMDIVRHRSLRSRTINNIYTWYSQHTGAVRRVVWVLILSAARVMSCIENCAECFLYYTDYLYLQLFFSCILFLV